MERAHMRRSKRQKFDLGSFMLGVNRQIELSEVRHDAALSAKSERQTIN